VRQKKPKVVGVLKRDFGHPFSLRQNKYTNVETGTSFPHTIHMGLVYLATRKPIEINHNTWIFCKYTVRSMETYGSESFNVNISSTGTTSNVLPPYIPLIYCQVGDHMLLFGDFNPFEKYARQFGSFPPKKG